MKKILFDDISETMTVEYEPETVLRRQITPFVELEAKRNNQERFFPPTSIRDAIDYLMRSELGRR